MSSDHVLELRTLSKGSCSPLYPHPLRINTFRRSFAAPRLRYNLLSLADRDRLLPARRHTYQPAHGCSFLRSISRNHSAIICALCTLNDWTGVFFPHIEREEGLHARCYCWFRGSLIKPDGGLSVTSRRGRKPGEGALFQLSQTRDS